MTTTERAIGFDGILRREDVPGSWRHIRTLEPLGYWVQSPEVCRGLTELQRVVMTIPPRWSGRLSIWWVYAPHLGKITTPAGFISDLASIPRALWPILAPHQIRRPAVHHDALYRLLREMYALRLLSRAEVRHYRYISDLLFREAMQHMDPTISRFKQQSAYRAVRLFGWIGF